VLSMKKLRERQKTAIRKIIIQKIDYAGKKKDFDDFVQELVLGHVASKIGNEAKKIALIKRVEVVKSALTKK
ncbi:30S ribosomal protein S3ae, partial [Candidatus Micrarchaeota archaeon]|nr:30S ribosomal protein S3ae [Candidatus Micrarchaeota archaeon]